MSTTYTVISDNHSGHDLPIGATVEPYTFTQGGDGDEVAIDPRDLRVTVATEGMPAIVLPDDSASLWLDFMNEREGHVAQIRGTDDTLRDVIVFAGARENGMPVLYAYEAAADDDQPAPNSVLEGIPAENITSITFY